MPGQGCSATCGGAHLVDPALSVALGSSSELVEALCMQAGLEPPNRHAAAFDRTCEPPANSHFVSARFLYFPEVRSWDCFPGESIDAIAPVFRSPCACLPAAAPRPPAPPAWYAEYPQLCASAGCTALSSLVAGFSLALCLAWCASLFCVRRRHSSPPSYYGDYGDYGGHDGGSKSESGYTGKGYGYSGRSYRGSGGFDENYGVNHSSSGCLGSLGCLGCLRLRIRLRYCWSELSYHASRCCRCCYRSVGSVSPYGHRSSYYADPLDERWRSTLSSPRGGTHRRSPERAYSSSYPGSYPSAYPGSYATASTASWRRPYEASAAGTPRYPRSPYRPEPHASGQPFSDAEVCAAFDRFDANRSGRLDHSELRGALRAFDLDVGSEQSISILQQYDTDGNGLMDVAEFGRLVVRLDELNGLDRSRATPTTAHTAHAAASPITAIVAGHMVGGSRWSDSDVRAAFDRFDANRSGRLDHSELRGALRALGGLELGSQEATAILQQYDADGNGLLDPAEFGLLVRRLSGLGGLPLPAAARTPGRAVRSTPSTPPRGLSSFEERGVPEPPRSREPPREHNALPRPYNAFRDQQPTGTSVGGGTIWGGAGPPPPGKQKPPQQTFFPPATRAPSGYSSALRDQMSMH